MIPLTQHAIRRCAQRGVRPDFIDDLIRLSDIETPVGSNCRLFRLSRDFDHRHAARDRLARYAVIWSDDSQSVVTVLPIHAGRRGRRYRNYGHRGGK